jgi:hypothetical protein
MAKREAEATSEFVRLPGEDGGRFGLTGRGWSCRGVGGNLKAA